MYLRYVAVVEAVHRFNTGDMDRSRETCLLSAQGSAPPLASNLASRHTIFVDGQTMFTPFPIASTTSTSYGEHASYLQCYYYNSRSLEWLALKRIA
jgi:hypothetical protein